MSIVKTEAFVLKSIKYGETSKIVTLYTREFGKMNAIVKGARNYRSKICGTLESMNYINAVIYFKENRELQLISNAEYKKSFPNIVSNFAKLETAFKVIETLNKSVLEQESNVALFELLKDVFTKLNSADRNYFIYVLFFQIQLSKNLGMNPVKSEDNSQSETLLNKIVVYTCESEFRTITNIANTSLEDLEKLEIDNIELMKLINSFEKYLSDCTQEFKYYKSTKVFQELNYRF